MTVFMICYILKVSLIGHVCMTDGGTFAGRERLLGGKVCWEGTFAGTGRLLGRNVCWEGTFAWKGCLLGRDDCWEGMIAGKGCLRGRDVCVERDDCWEGMFAGKGCLHGRDVCWEGMFARKGGLLGRDVLYAMHDETVLGMGFWFAPLKTVPWCIVNLAITRSLSQLRNGPLSRKNNSRVNPE